MINVAPTLRLLTIALAIGGLGLLAGCDSSATGPQLSTQTVEGTVTDEDGSAKRAGPIAGATVTAEAITSQGDRRPLDGQAETNSSGRYELEITEPARSMILRAEGEDGFTAQTLVQLEDPRSDRAEAMPMNAETAAEAEVYVQARQDGGAAVTKSDVALYVDTHLAAAIEEGGATVAEVARSIQAQVQAERSYVAEHSDSGEEQAEEGTAHKARAFDGLETALARSSGAEDRVQAHATLETALSNAYTEAGVSAQIGAQAQLTGQAGLDLQVGSAPDSTSALFGLTRRAALGTSRGIARAIEASFEAEGAGTSRLEALATAQATLVETLRTASRTEARDQARAAFATTVRSELASEIGTTVSAIDSAQTALTESRSTLRGAISRGTSARNLASAHATFFQNARATVTDRLGPNGQAELAASVLALLSLH